MISIYLNSNPDFYLLKFDLVMMFFLIYPAPKFIVLIDSLISQSFDCAFSTLTQNGVRG